MALAQDWRAASVAFDAVLHAGPAQPLLAVLATLALRRGAIVGVTAWPNGTIGMAGAEGPDSAPLERLVIERSISINTAAAGGNASLMTIG